MQKTPTMMGIKASTMEDKVPTAVPQATAATQAGEINPKLARRQRWGWAEASIWTDRMLAALETEVKGGCWFSLIDKVYSPKNLWSAWAKSAKNNRCSGSGRHYD